MHAGFGKRPGETGPPKGGHRAPGRLYRPPTAAIVDYIDAYRERFGVESICRLHSSIGHVPPVEYETAYYRHNLIGRSPRP